MHPAVDLIFGHLFEVQPECDVFINSHMRIERVVLEYHRDVAVFGSNVVDHPVTDIQFALADILKPCNHTQRCGLSASGRADEDHELLVLDLKVQIGNYGNVARIDFFYMFECDTCHNALLPNHTSRVIS